MIGVLGASGAVGTAAAGHLVALGRRVRLGVRDPDRSPIPAGRRPDRVDVTVVDLRDDAALARFCAGCRVVLNCAGPAVAVLDRAARAAVRAGAAYVDAAGDDPLYELLSAGPGPGVPVVVSAGMTPGLSAVLPRYLAAHSARSLPAHSARSLPAHSAARDRATRLTVYHGGRDRFTPTAAVDYLAALDTGFGEPGAAWRDGAPVRRALPELSDVDLPFFPEPVHAYPYLSTETRRVARRLGLTDVSWYSVFAGRRVLDVLRSRAAFGADLTGAARALCEAAALDAFGAAPYQVFALQLDGPCGGATATRSLVLRAPGASPLTGAVAAMTAIAVTDGAWPVGVHHAGEALDPQWTVETLRRWGAVTAVSVLDTPVDTALDQECDVL